MPDRGPSSTALGVALLRAAHQLIDDPPRILDDPVVLRLLGEPGRHHVERHRERMELPSARALRSHVVVRSRWAEERLADAVLRGVRQLVVLGAGLDTFAFRQPAWGHSLRIVELDGAAAQRDKRERIAAVDIAVPANVAFAPIDFESDSLADVLVRAGVDLGAPIFLSWLGVTMYLSEDAVDGVLRTVCGLARGTELVLSFAPPELRTDEGTAEIPERAAAVGEPFRTYFTAEEMEAKLRHVGFAEIHPLTPAEAAARWFAARRDGLPAPRRTTVGAAVV
jgi:methyltransferase (TIGR00027 family)